MGLDKNPTAHRPYQDGVQNIYKAIQCGHSPDRHAVLRVVDDAEPNKREESLAFLASECALPMMPVFDHYITEHRERAAFLGFCVLPRNTYLLTERATTTFGDMKAISSRYLLQKNFPAGAPTTLDILGPEKLIQSPYFFSKNSIHLPKNATDELEQLHTMNHVFSDSVRRILCDIREQMRVPLFRYFTRCMSALSTKERIEHVMFQERLQDLYRSFIDTTCLLEENLYALTTLKKESVSREDVHQHRDFLLQELQEMSA